MKGVIHSIIEKIRIWYDKNKYPSIFTIVMLILSYYSVNKISAEISIIGTALLLVLCYITSQEFPKVGRSVTKLSIWEKIALIFLWLYTTLAVVGVHILDEEGVSFSHIKYLVLSAVWIFPICALLYVKIKDFTEHRNITYTTGFALTSRIVMFCVMVLFCTMFLIAFNPAVTSVDSEFCYSNASLIGKEPVPGDHPFFYLLLLGALEKVSKSISFLVVIQYSFFSLVFVGGINLLRRLGLPKWTCWLVYLFFGLGYNTIIQLVTLWKDIPYTASVLWVTILLAEIMVFPQKDIKPIWYFQFPVACVFMSALRHNGFIPITITLLFFFIVKRNKRINICIVVTFLLMLAVKYPLHDYLRIQDEGYKGLEYSALASDIEYVYYHGGEVSKEGEELVFKLADYNFEEYSSTSWYVHNNYQNIGDYGIIEFLRIYLDSFIKNPVLMTKGILIRSNYAWTVEKPQNGRETCIATLTESHSYEDRLVLHIPHREDNFLTTIFTNIVNIFNRSIFIHNIYWRVGIYNIFILSIFVILLMRRKKYAYFAIPFLPIILNTVVLVIACGWPNYRYYWPSMVLCGFLIPYGVGVMVAEPLNSK